MLKSPVLIAVAIIVAVCCSFSNPVVTSILVMIALCLLKFNILLSILVSALIAGVTYKHVFAGFERDYRNAN